MSNHTPLLIGQKNTKEVKAAPPEYTTAEGVRHGR